MGINDMNIPREKGTFTGMMEHFFQAFTDMFDDEDSKGAKVENKGQEVHVHIHTGAANKNDENIKVSEGDD